jgi:exodeoxyribonuclease III
MSFTLATWNINSIRLREQLVARLLTEEQPDILCLQEAADVFKFNDLTS